MLARGAAAEIVVGHENPGLAVGGLVEDEIGVFAAVIAIALLRKKSRGEPRTLDGFEVLLGNDHVGIDVDHAQRRGHAIESGEFFHGFVPYFTPETSYLQGRVSNPPLRWGRRGAGVG